MTVPVVLFFGGLVIALPCFIVFAVRAFTFRFDMKLLGAFIGFAIGGVLNSVGIVMGGYQIVKVALHL